MKASAMIGFRPSSQQFHQNFLTLVGELEVSQAELAERAVIKGLEEAAEELKGEKIRKAKTTVSKLSGLALRALCGRSNYQRNGRASVPAIPHLC